MRAPESFTFAIPGLCLSGAGMLILWVGYKLLRIPFSLLIDMISHHPANLDFANNQTGNKIPTYGYAPVYPLLLIGKIIFVQVLFQALR